VPRRGEVLEIADAHRDALAAVGLETLADYFESPAVESVRLLPDRENVRIEAGGEVYFGKRLPRSHVGDARRERRMLRVLREAGFPVPELAVYGEGERGGLVLTARLPGAPLDDLLREGRVPPEEQREVARRLGELVRRFHAAGFWHRDLYLCHVFAARTDDGWSLGLIDVSRVGHRRWPRSRWFVKDVAALWHSLPRERVRPAVVGEFLRGYRDRRRGLGTRRFLRRVLLKARRMARHAPRWPG
jgi:tRNA A-37 threonylcarbamoyl transferase component Bud32